MLVGIFRSLEKILGSGSGRAPRHGVRFSRLMARGILMPAILANLSITFTARAEDHIRGQITAVDASRIDVRTTQGANVRIRLTNEVTVLRLSPGSFADVDFGTYVGSVSEKMDDRYSPIYRDSLSWLYKGLELRVIDESLRGIAVGHMQWDLTPASVMTHGWVDDLEVRVLSIKYGPTEAEETDVEINRDVRILKMSMGDRGVLKSGAHVFAGATKGPDGIYSATFLMVGADGVVPGL
jgi:hypothetical protein